MNRHHIDEQRLTMGQIITAMKELDRSRSKPFFSDHDYEYLFLVTKTRNEYAHNVYAHFCYLDVEEEFERSYNRCCANLLKDRNWLFKLYEAVYYGHCPGGIAGIDLFLRGGSEGQQDKREEEKKVLLHEMYNV